MGINNITIFQWLGQQIDSTLDQTVFHAITGFTDVFSVPIYLLITIYLIWKGYLIVMGQSDQYFSDYIMTVLKISIITYFALNVVHFTMYIEGGIHALTVALISSVSGGSNTSVDSIYVLLDKTLISALKQIEFCYTQFSFLPSGNFGWILAILAIVLSYGPVIISAATIIIGVEILIKLLFVIAPICFIFAMFPSSKKVFDSWVSKMLEMIFTLIMSFATIIIMTTIFSTWVSANKFSNELNPYAISVQLIVLGWVVLWVLKQVNQMAASLAGGFATSALQIADITKNAAAPIVAAMNVAKFASNPAAFVAKNITQSLIDKANARGNQIANPNTPGNNKKPKQMDATAKRIDEINRQSRS